MSLIVLIGAQAVGKMTVGKELEQRIDGKLLFNHQTIDVFANFLGYNKYTFDLSNNMRLDLFRSFVKNIGHNLTNSIIFTVMIDFSQDDDIDFLNEISTIFLDGGEDVFFIELVSSLEERLKRNTHPLRLEAKPSKRDIDFSTNEIKHTAKNFRLETAENELEELFPRVNSLKIDNTALSPDEVCQLILAEYPNL